MEGESERDVISRVKDSFADSLEEASYRIEFRQQDLLSGFVNYVKVEIDNVYEIEE